MKVIGITGGVGAGKSSILDYLKSNYNCRILMADDLAKSLCKKGEVCYDRLIAVLGNDTCDGDGEIDRAIMAKKIFVNPKLIEMVNQIIHPAVKERILSYIRTEKEDRKIDYFFIEAALLIEDGYKEIVDELWYIYTDEEIRRTRLKASRGYSDEKIDSILKNQLSDAEFRANSDFVIDNSHTTEESYAQIRERMMIYG